MPAETSAWSDREIPRTKFYESVQRMIEDNTLRRSTRSRACCRPRLSQKTRRQITDDPMMAWVIGVPVVLFVLAFLVFMYAMLPRIIDVVIKATAKWQALFH